MNPHRDQTRIVLGVFVIIIGVLALADNLFQINTHQLIQFWPAVFVAVGAIKISQTRRHGGYFVGAVFMAIGVLMTLSNIGWISFHLRDWWPLFLIGAGIAMISRGSLRRRFDECQLRSDGTVDTGSELDGFNAVAVMSGNKLSVVSQDFRQGEATAIMGGVEIDFRQASIQTEAQLRVFAVWGGIELKVPSDWSVECRAMAIMGGIEDKTIPAPQSSKRLVLDGFVMMGGVVVKN
jgi:predicted membrane protein